MANLRAFRQAAILSLSACLVACSGGSSDTALSTHIAATVYAEQTSGSPGQTSQTLPTARPTRTPAVTPGPTATMQVMLSGESYTLPSEPISPINAGRLTELAWLGYGGSVGFTQPTAAGYSPDGRWLAVAVAQGVYLLDGATFEVVRPLADTADVQELAFSGDGKLMAFQTRGAVQIWRLEQDELWRELSLAGDSFGGWRTSSIALSYDGLRMLRLSESAIEIWDTAATTRSGRLPFAAEGSTYTIDDTSRVAYSPTGEYFVALRASSRGVFGSLPSMIDIYRASDNTKVDQFRGVAFAFTPDGTVLASTSGFSLEFRRLADGKVIGEARSFGKVADFAPDGGMYVTFSGRSVVISRTTNGDRRGWFEPGHDVVSAQYSPDGSQLLVLAGALELWDVKAGTLTARLADRMDPVGTLRFSPDGRMLASRHTDGVLRLWRVADGAVLHRLDGDRDLEISFEDRSSEVAMSSSLSFAPNEDTLAIARGRDGFSYWDITNGVHRYSIELNNCNPAAGVAYSSDGLWLASIGDPHQSICLLPITDEDKPTYLRVEEQGRLTSIEISRDGTLMAAGGHDGRVWVWKVEDRKLLWSQPLHGEYKTVTDLEFSADGSLLASAGDDGVVRLREALSGAPVTEIINEFFALSGLALSPAGEVVAVTSRDGNGAGLYDARSGDSLRVMAPDFDMARVFAFSPDGKLLAASFEDGTIRLYGVR